MKLLVNLTNFSTKVPCIHLGNNVDYSVFSMASTALEGAEVAHIIKNLKQRKL